MKKVTFTVEIGKDGYSAWHEPANGSMVTIMGNTFAILKINAVEAYNLMMSTTTIKPITDRI